MTYKDYGNRLPSATAAEWLNGLPVISKKCSHESFKKGLKTFLENILIQLELNI